jgi:hypothetical protein
MSQICAYELHKLVPRHLPHVLKDSKKLVRSLESVSIPTHHARDSVNLITGDVSGLYVNILIYEAIQCVTDFVVAHSGPDLAHLLQSWLKLVFHGALVRFGNRFFVQTWGFPWELR